MTKPTGKPVGRPPGRPKGSKDARPLLLGLLQRYRLYPVLMAEFEAAKKDMTPKERLQFSLELAKLGIQASPRTLDGDGERMQLIMNITGFNPKGQITQDAVDVTPGALPAASQAVYPALPHGKAKKCPAFQEQPEQSKPTPDPPPHRGPIFTVPRGPDEGGVPVEWRTPLFPNDIDD